VHRWRIRLAALEPERDLPWRDTRDPWAVLVAEAMLQQTQVSRVVPAWSRFLENMGTPAACASAPQAAVVMAWEGLGYHRRAVWLHHAAGLIVERHDGVVPDALDELLRLPGVGPYSARAVLAFAFERDVAVVDTNVARVLARAIAARPLAAAEAQELADRLVSPSRGWAHNQAMLDLGALSCTPRPRCATCPIKRSCLWRRAGFQEPDPARTTAGTSRPQARFEGSDRQLRGLVLAIARDAEPTAPWRPPLEERFSAARVEAALEALVADGLVAFDGDRVALA
jgi:A/G-specific adenine glycosylase